MLALLVLGYDPLLSQITSERVVTYFSPLFIFVFFLHLLIEEKQTHVIPMGWM